MKTGKAPHSWKARLLGVAAALGVLAFVLPAHGETAVPPAEQGAGVDTASQAPDERKAEREEELAALTRDIELSAERQAAIAREIRTIDRDHEALNLDLLRTAQRIKGLEDQLAATETRLRRLVTNEDRVRQSLAERQDVLAEVLSALQRIGRRPPPALAVRPEDALGAVRGALLLNAVMPEIHIEAQALASDLAELRRLKNSIASERDRLQADAGRLAEERKRVELIIASKKRQRDENQAELDREKTRAEELAGKASSLKDLIASLEQEIESARKAAEAARKADSERQAERDRKVAEGDPFADPGRLAPAVAFVNTKGKLPLPVAGSTLRRFGEDDGFGGSTEGQSISTRPSAQVTAPTDGWVVYAGPFRSYGQLLILNAGDGYHVLLAGLDRIDVELGQFVLAGEPVAAMGSTQLASAATLDLAATLPVLYVEFRKDGIAIDPSPWWDRAEDEKVRG
ncbi:murein hydrolase activator EnvC family protein [Stappia albiluteola]|uniref:murein hydrolase activator EnvC family protein n=1 Tax=Stappia albiluteola TaxID=2758565 RepID=UPI001AD8B2B4|nr:peptidoglycan DD-metalloendopeptidase family protein [Stappia albiluteola]